MPQSIGYVLSALLFIFLIVLIVVAAAGGSVAEGDEVVEDAAADEAVVIDAASDAEVNAGANVEAIDPDEGEVTAASAEASAADNPCGDSVTLGNDETLFAIAQRCDTSVAAILASNPDISDVTRIPVGATIALPNADAEAESANDDVTAVDAVIVPTGSTVYVIQPGDTLARIARQRGVTLVQLTDVNPDISDPDSIRVGQTIVLPASE